VSRSPREWSELVAAAWRARENAYAPYSRYKVGAALLADDGRVFVGANVENASYGLCLCAERSAVAAAVVSGAQRFVAIAIVSQGTTPASPCGMCRQVLAEFAPPFDVLCESESGVRLETTTFELLPFAFDPATLAAAQSSDRVTLAFGGEAIPGVELPHATSDATLAVEDPLRQTAIMGSSHDGHEGPSDTEPPPPLNKTDPRGGRSFFAGVALKVAAGTGEELASMRTQDYGAVPIAAVVRPVEPTRSDAPPSQADDDDDDDGVAP
jgi:cytidine deaminase